MLEAMEIEILSHLYELGVLNLHGGWERQSNLDENAVERLYSAKLVEKRWIFKDCILVLHNILLKGFRCKKSEHFTKLLKNFTIRRFE
jgi:hypothetical protein